MTEDPQSRQSGDPSVSGPGLEGAGDRKVTLRIDDSRMSTVYANAFRTMATSEELSLDLGVNSIRPSTQQQGGVEVVFDTSTRLIMNYYMAKRMAMALGRVVRNYEQRFGELELDPKQRARGAESGDIIDPEST